MAKLKKEQMLPGTILKVHDDRPLSNGLASMLPMGGPGQSRLGAIAWPAMNAYPSSKGAKGLDASSAKFSIQPGALVEMIDGPKNRGGVNSAYIREQSTGREGHVFWCELQACCSIPASLAASASPPAPRKPKL